MLMEWKKERRKEGKRGIKRDKHFLSMESESESPSVVSDSLRPHGLHSPWNSPGKNTGVGRLPLLQGIFPTQGLNPGLPYIAYRFFTS